MVARLRRFAPHGGTASGLVEGVRMIGPRRGLVFVVSDFLLPEAELTAVFEALSPHDVIPVVLMDSGGGRCPAFMGARLRFVTWKLAGGVSSSCGLRSRLSGKGGARPAGPFFRRVAKRYGRSLSRSSTASTGMASSAALLRGA